MSAILFKEHFNILNIFFTEPQLHLRSTVVYHLDHYTFWIIKNDDKSSNQNNQAHKKFTKAYGEFSNDLYVHRGETFIFQKRKSS